MDNPENLEYYHPNTIANYDPSIIPFLNAPYGSAFGGSGTITYGMYKWLNHQSQSVNSNTIDYLRHHPTELGKVMPHCKIEFFMYNGKIVDFFNKKTK